MNGQTSVLKHLKTVKLPSSGNRSVCLGVCVGEHIWSPGQFKMCMPWICLSLDSLVSSLHTQAHTQSANHMWMTWVLSSFFHSSTWRELMKAPLVVLFFKSSCYIADWCAHLLLVPAMTVSEDWLSGWTSLVCLQLRWLVLLTLLLVVEVYHALLQISPSDSEY